jgi:hypothetical protein
MYRNTTKPVCSFFRIPIVTVLNHCYLWHEHCLIHTVSWIQHEAHFPMFQCSFFVVSWGGVRLSPLSTSAANWPILPAPDDRRWMWGGRCNENWQGKPKYSEKICSRATLSTINPTWPDLGSNPGRRGGKPATNSLSYGAACVAK